MNRQVLMGRVALATGAAALLAGGALLAWNLAIGRPGPDGRCPTVDVLAAELDPQRPASVLRAGGLPPLVAYGMGRPRLMRLLLALGANAQACWMGAGALANAAMVGDTEAVRALLAAGAPLEAPLDADGQTPLYAAIRQGRVHTVTLLLAHGARLAPAGPGAPPIDLAGEPWPPGSARHHEKLALARLLLAQGVAVNQRLPPRHATALIHAAQWGDADMVALLLAHGADPLLRDDRGQTAAQLAQRRGHAAVVALLGARAGR